MTIPWEAVESSPVRALVAGGAVLLAGLLVVALTRQPARRVWVGMAAVVAALMAIPLSLVPGWVKVSVPVEAGAASPAGITHAPIGGGNETDRPDQVSQMAALPEWELTPAKAG